MSEKPQIDLLIAAAKRGVPTLMPYLWSLIFIIVMLSLVYFLRLDWWVAGFGILVIMPSVVLLFLIKQVLRSPRKDIRPLALSTMWFFAILFAASVTLFVSSAFFGWPLNFRPTATPVEDGGVLTIRKFYKLTDQGQFEAAWELIHSKRKEEIAEKIPNWQEFAKAYVTTREHRYIEIERIQDTTALDRTYRVSFAVRDEFPISHLYRSRPSLIKDWFEAYSLDKKRIVDIVINDVRNAFDVPKSAAPKIAQFIDRRRFESLFKPGLIYDIGMELRLVPKKRPLDSPESVWQFFVQKVQLQEDKSGTWKIKSGLYPRLVEAMYEPGASAP